jgi:hypothetical protein
MLKIPHPEKLNGQIEIDNMGYLIHFAVENENWYMFLINQILLNPYSASAPDLRTYGLSIYRDYVTIDDMGEDIYNSIGIKKIVKIQLTTLEQKVVHMISLTDLKDIERFKRVVEGMVIGLNEKIDNQNVFPPLQQWTGSSHITHSTSHGTW